MARRAFETSTSAAWSIQTLGRVDFDLLSETEIVRHVIDEARAGRGGWIITPNVDILRQVRIDPEALMLVQRASLRVPDGMPLIWAGRIGGKPFIERVTGSSLIFSLTEAAASSGLSIYLLGGEPGIPEVAGENLGSRYQGLKITGTDAPPFGFDKSATGVAAVRQRLLDAAPNIVYVGLGFPKQERLIGELVAIMPATWFVGCGAAISFAAGTTSRAPVWMQRYGLEWVHRMAQEPRRLGGRYLRRDLPYAFKLLASSVASRIIACFQTQ